MEPQLRVIGQNDLSAEATVLAGTYQLGEPQAEYKIGLKKWMVTYIWMGIIGAIIGIVLAVLGLMGMASDDSAWQLAVVGVACFFGCLYLIARYARYPLVRRSWKVVVCAKGFIFTKNGQAEAFAWDQIESVWQEIKVYKKYGTTTGTTYKYTVRRKDGVQVLIDDTFEDNDVLGQKIVEEAHNVQLPLAIEAFHAGQTLHFGPLSISAQGLSNGKELLPWDGTIRRINISNGYFEVKKTDKLLLWANIEVSKIPNVLVLHNLIRYITSPSPEAEQVDAK
ncbi:DUF6585 family protein [Tengunoibacter tsumagoiensis]|uniref:Uncharacterized protein n=1 Tax=Tengunoibacter tsumagoiensis TaxID=2014871 RepID=A0A402AAC4_9CHLR|nr:DUF6585 family protein [Tengunoibacter tsumagoiensis]GCE16124.1 hypothetical protein KTT_59830 [Tengunoibacter tsumagoiensis]